MDEELLYSTIYNRLAQEDKELTSLTEHGVFFAPELYLAFILGKEIKKYEMKIFGQQTEWIRETDFRNGGPTDFAFETKTDKKTYVFEVKLRSKVESYSRDIEKLKKLDNSYSKYFLAIIDSWDTQRENDNRIVSIEKLHLDISRVSAFKGFPTIFKAFQGDIYCTIGLWKLNQ
jgi:hypothetical protein